MRLKPRKGESKQSFLARCAREQKKAGMADAKAMSSCAGVWNEQRMSDADEDIAKLTCPVSVQLADSSPDGESPARFAILAYTGKLVEWGWMRFVIDLKGISAKDSFPCLRDHTRDRIVGTCDQWSIDANGMHVMGQFSAATTDGIEVLALAKEGFPWQASVGIRALAVEQLEVGKTRKVNGVTLEGPLEIWTQSVVQEVSFVSLGADDDTAAIVMGSPTEENMNKRLKSLLVRMGLAHDATDEQAVAFLASLGDDGKTLVSACDANLAADNTPAPPAAPVATPVATLSAEEVKSAVERALSEDRKRVSDISGLFSKLKLPDSIARELHASGASLADARMRAIDEIEKMNPAMHGAAEFGADESDKFRALASEGIYLRSGGRIEKPTNGSGEFRAMSMVDFARLCLERGGESTRGLSSTKIASMILGSSMQLAASTSDFRAIFMDVANRRMLSGYTEAPQTFRPWVNIVTATDFRDMHGISLSEAPDLEEVTERGEYKTGNLKDNQESYSIKKYGKILSLTLEMIVNDDLRAFTRIPELFGAATSRKVSDVVYALLLSNPVMKDGNALFYSGRGNIEATVKTPVSSDALSAARKAMRTRKGPNGAHVNVSPTFLLVPAAQETAAEVLIRSMSLPTADMSAGVHNPWAGKLTPISDPRLDDISDKAWYLVASPSQVDTMEIAFLDGVETPTITEADGFRNDSVDYKCRIVFGAGVMDTLGFFKNPGA